LHLVDYHWQTISLTIPANAITTGCHEEHIRHEPDQPFELRRRVCLSEIERVNEDHHANAVSDLMPLDVPGHKVTGVRKCTWFRYAQDQI
jgi:hypothetical protein